MKKIFFILLYTALTHAREEDVPHIYKGNLALPTSQEPSPLFCFGQSIVDKGDILAYLYASNLLGKQSNFTQVIPNIMYGITDELVMTIGMPIAAKFKFNNFQSSGIGDIFVQFEYAFYNKDRPSYANQATFVANMTFPSGSPKKAPPTGFGTPTFFLGVTANHMDINWYIFACAGGTIIPPYHNTKQHSNFLYQWGIGRNVHYVPLKRVATVILEFFGSYSKETNIRGPVYKNFDDNNFYIGPSLWFATERFIFNPGIAFSPLSHKKDPTRSRFIFACEIGWKFN